MELWSSWWIPLLCSGISNAQPLHKGEDFGALKIGCGLSSMSLQSLNDSLLAEGFTGVREQGMCIRLELQVVESKGLTVDGRVGLMTFKSHEATIKKSEMNSAAIDLLFGFEIIGFSERTSLYPMLGPGLRFTETVLRDGSEEAGTWKRADVMLIGGLNSFHLFGSGPGCMVIGLSGELGWGLTSGGWDAKDPKVDLDPAPPGMFMQITASLGYGVFRLHQ